VSVTADDLMKLVVAKYLSSDEFNGLPVREVTGGAGMAAVRQVISDGRARLNFGAPHPNPHILGLELPPVGDQLKALGTQQALTHVCLYPSAAHLRSHRLPRRFANRPFTKELARGSPQLTFRFFDLTVLEAYRNDPRYLYRTTDISGYLSISDRFDNSESMPDPDKILLQHFGFGYSRDISQRVVCVCLRDLSRLTPEHQAVWAARRLDGEYLPHPDFWRMVMGEWGEGVSLFSAFLEELHHTNELARLMGGPPFYLRTYTDDGRPTELSWLIRPTLREFNGFVHLLDKLMSENLNREFFAGRVELESERQRGDGKVVVTQKGTIALLEDWLAATFRPKDPGPITEMLAAFREVRRRRQKPAHAAQDDAFDQGYFKEQRDLSIKAYAAVRTIRLILQNHPACRNHRVPDFLNEQIWTY
jgi:hypothetical protein